MKKEEAKAKHQSWYEREFEGESCSRRRAHEAHDAVWGLVGAAELVAAEYVIDFRVWDGIKGSGEKQVTRRTPYENLNTQDEVYQTINDFAGGNDVIVFVGESELR